MLGARSRRRNIALDDPPVTSIRATLDKAPDTSAQHLWGRAATIALADLREGTSLDLPLRNLAGRSVLVASREQMTAALALIELDGAVRRIVICTPEISPGDLATVLRNGEIDAVVSDHPIASSSPLASVPLHGRCSHVIQHVSQPLPAERFQTEWVLLTSGTTGAPKMVVHDFQSLTAPIGAAAHHDPDVVWGTFYDIRRYGGLQIFLRFLLGRGSFVVSGGESQSEYLMRLGRHGVTHLSGTPSHWRRGLMCREARLVRPRYVRLSGEIADQGILNALRAFFPGATVGHAFASTEAGVAFEVNDGLEGFPASMLEANPDVEMKIQDGSLWIRSARNAACYLGEQRDALDGAAGFVDTGDLVERRGDRYYFLGRRNGVINIGGNKVYPEEVEAVINRHPAVRMSMVRAKPSRIMGALVVADIVMAGASDGADAGDRSDTVKREILQSCQENLAAYKIPAIIRFVPTLNVAAAGKLARHGS
ncbi:MAG TPA: fatty acid--CoA ligase family protein [Vicinamibacterales bacterium]